jgi:hypothetical protein
MKKRLFGLLAAGALIALSCAGPTFAQGSDGAGGQTNGAQDNRDDGFDYGWLGLLGLAGLAGLRRPAPTVVHRDATTRS